MAPDERNARIRRRAAELGLDPFKRPYPEDSKHFIPYEERFRQAVAEADAFDKAASTIAGEDEGGLQALLVDAMRDGTITEDEWSQILGGPEPESAPPPPGAPGLQLNPMQPLPMGPQMPRPDRQPPAATDTTGTTTVPPETVTRVLVNLRRYIEAARSGALVDPETGVPMTEDDVLEEFRRQYPGVNPYALERDME